MMSHLLDAAIVKMKPIVAYLDLCEMRDQSLAGTDGVLKDSFIANGQHRVPLKEERVFRHCTVITNLYAIYEKFIEDAIRFWVARLPRYYKFAELREKFNNTYRYRVAGLIRDINKRQYRHLSLLDVIDKYHKALAGEEGWQIVPEALTAHENNLRRAELERLFGSSGLVELWGFLEETHDLLAAARNIADDKTIAALLDDFVTYRNEASHGNPDEILGVKTLRAWIPFFQEFCAAAGMAVTHKILVCERDLGSLPVYGKVTEEFSNNIVVAKCIAGQFKIGKRLYFVRSRSCILACIESLQLNKNNVEEVTLSGTEIEVGIRTSVPVKRGAQIVDVPA